MTEKMLERVARALCAQGGHDPDRKFIDRSGHTQEYPWWEAYRDAACAAVEAMCEPNDALREE